jgi:hypothetical protein
MFNQDTVESMFSVNVETTYIIYNPNTVISKFTTTAEYFRIKYLK